MANTNINSTKPLILELGGVVRLVDGSSGYDFQQKERGTLEIEPGGYEVLRYQNSGINQIPVEGSEGTTKVRLRVKLTSLAATQIVTLLQARDTATGLVKVYGLEVIWYKTKDPASESHKATLTEVYASAQPKIKAGTDFDTVEIELESNDPLPALLVTTP